MTTTTPNMIEKHRELTREIDELRADRSQIGGELRMAGIQADEDVKGELETAVTEAQATANNLVTALSTAELRKAALDKRIDAGDDSVTALELTEADMAVRSTRGKQGPADAAVRKGKRGLDPFLADNHLALLAAATIEDLVDVPVLVRARPGDVQGFTDAIVLSQLEATEGYGTFKPSGRVRFTEIGTTELDREALETALQNTGSDVQVHSGLIDFEVALWPKPRLKSPSEDEVTGFANLLARVFQATAEGRTRNRTYSTYSTLWETTEASLDVTEPGRSTGKVVANVGIDRERPPLSQMSQLINDALGHFDVGTHTSAGVLEEITVVEILDAGPWVPDGQPFNYGREYPQRFIVKISLSYSYEPVEEV